MKAFILVIISFITLVIVFATNKRHVELHYVDATHFCMYMDSYNSDKLGLVACFEGDAHDVNGVDSKLSVAMQKSMPFMAMPKTMVASD